MTSMSIISEFWEHGCKLGALLLVLAILIYFINVTAPKRWREP